MKEKPKVTPSSGNVFADLGLPNPEEHRVKATLALSIAEMIKDRGLTQVEAARVLGLSQPNISNLVRGKLEKVSLDRLIRYLRRLGCDVTISFKPKLEDREDTTFKVEHRPNETTARTLTKSRAVVEVEEFDSPEEMVESWKK